ncbi:hypothetical protein OAH99_00495 [Planktomarina sp.]|nr:hypothetical protein [Planktomarina sp.]
MSRFLLYRMVEKLFGFRLESLFGLFIFRMFFNQMARSHFSIVGDDKRSIWEELRCKEVNEDFNSHIRKLFAVGSLSFENSMETSIRGINCILAIAQGLRDESDYDFLQRYIKCCYYHTKLCPDLYIKRTGFKLRDESNNHRLYNLLFLQFYGIHRGEQSSFSAIEAFVNKRLASDYFYDEGASFYHYGVIDGLLKLRSYARSKKLEKSFSSSFNDFLDKSDTNLRIFRDLNFGDRDGTIIAPWMTTNAPFSVYVHDIDTDKFFLSVSGANTLCIRKENWCDLGTQGHVHDDFGQLIYKSPDANLIDPGVFKYSEEPFLSKKKFHNFPYDREFPEIHYVRKFERQVPRNKYIDTNETGITLREIGNGRSLTREFNPRNWCVDDYVVSDITQDVSISWRFLLEGAIDVAAQQSQIDQFINVGKSIQFKLHPDAFFRICQSQYYPEYGKSNSCRALLINLKMKIEKEKKIKLLTVSFRRYKEAG